ncbi:MAG TPA: enoyl-CoA hydratase-related protein [Caulobacteraceae bacterium]|nr:enoyl-CoA hydratase-related protein [Caulobacteraceae bacterium]
MSDADILFETMGRVALIRLNRPQALNALTYAMLADIRRLVATAEKDPEVTAIAFVGEGRGFCSGLDAEVLRQTTQAGEARGGGGGGDESRRDPPGMFSYLTQVSKPVISAVNGVAAGGGFVLAMMSDLRFGSEAASFTTVFSKRGLIAEHGTSWVLPRLVGPSRALDLLWSSRRVQSEEALRIGLLDRVVPHDELLAAVVAYVDDLAAQISPGAIAVMKSQVYRHLSQGMEPALVDADRLTQEQLKHPDAREGAMALIERRAPNFEPWTGERP